MLCTRDSIQFRSKDTHTKTEGMIKIFHTNENENEKKVVAILTSDKSDFKMEDKKRQRKALHIDRGRVNPRVYNICKYLCIQYRIT